MCCLLSIDDLSFGYGDEAVLRGILMDIRGSEILGIVGPNGSGKTTLIKCINKILEPVQGHIYLEGEDIKGLSRREVASRVGYVPQSSSSSMSLPTVYEVVLMGRTPHSMWKNAPDDEELVWNAMEKLSVTELADRGFNELSSGQTQRVLIARAMAQEAKLLLLDEPTSNLDVKYQLEVMGLMRDLVNREGISACAIVHDLNLAIRYCDRVLMLKDGEIKAFGKTLDVLTPQNIKEIFDIDAEIIEYGGLHHLLIL